MKRRDNQATLSDAKTRSKRPSKVTEMPTAGPLMTAARGFEKSMNEFTNVLQTSETIVIVSKIGMVIKMGVKSYSKSWRPSLAAFLMSRMASGVPKLLRSFPAQ